MSTSASQSEFVPSCNACGKKVKCDDAVVCAGCMDFTACSAECWTKIGSEHQKTCCCDVGLELGLCEEEKAGEDVGARHGGGGGKTIHYKTGMHYSGRHPKISQSKLRTMLHCGSVRGHSLAPAQRGYFGHLLSPAHSNKR